MMRKIYSIATTACLSTVLLMLGSMDVLAADMAQAMAQFVPSRMEAGKQYSVMIQFKNASNTTWTGSEYMLGAKNPSNNTFWGTKRVKLSPGDSIRPGATLTVKFQVTAPSKAG